MLALTSLSSISLGCNAVVDQSEALGTKAQAVGSGTTVRFVGAYSSGNKVTVTCDGTTPYALSVSRGSAVCEDAVTTSNVISNDGVPVGGRVIVDGEVVYASVLCSDYDAPERIREFAADGDHTVMCPPGFIAVGGEGSCDSATGKLVRNRPIGADGEPRGWRASCSSGGVYAGVNCVEKGGSGDWDGCQIGEKMVFGNATTAVCQGDDRPIAAGTRCGAGGYIIDNSLDNTLAYAVATCTEANTRALAICCPGVTQIP